MQRGAALVVALACVVGLIAAPLARAGRTAATVFHTEEIPVGGKIFVVTCPRGYVATAGSVYTPGALIAPITGRASGAGRSWTFAEGNPGPGAKRVTVAVRCIKLGSVKLPAGAVKLALKRAFRTTPVTVAPPTVKTPRVACPTGDSPSGYTEQQQQAPPKAVDRNAVTPAPGVTITSAVPGPDGWSFAVSASTTQTVRLGVICIPRSLRIRDRLGRQYTVALNVQTLSATSTAAPGEQVLRTSCPAHSLALGSGYAYEAGGPLRVLGQAYSGDGTVLTRVSNRATSPVDVALYATCLGTRLPVAAGSQIITIVGPPTITG